MSLRIGQRVEAVGLRPPCIKISHFPRAGLLRIDCHDNTLAAEFSVGRIRGRIRRLRRGRSSSTSLSGAGEKQPRDVVERATSAAYGKRMSRLRPPCA